MSNKKSNALYSEARESSLFEKDGNIVIGIDPGPKNTGFCVIDGEVPLFAATITRDDKMTAEDFAFHVRDYCITWVNEIIEKHPQAIIAIEGVVAPRSHMHGKKSFINPNYILRLGFLAGILFGTFPEATRIRPGNNGSGHTSQYPTYLSGRRNFTVLPGHGKGVRDHEKSAYDVARKATRPQY